MTTEDHLVIYVGLSEDQKRFEETTGYVDRHLGRGVLVEGQVYKVVREQDRIYHTRYWLEGIPNTWFNSRCFREKK